MVRPQAACPGIAAYRDAQKAWQELAGRAGASDPYTSKLAAATGNAANCLGNLGQEREAVAEMRRSVGLLKGLVAAHPDNDLYQLQRAQATSNLGVLYFKGRETGRAAEAFGEAADALEGLARKHPESTPYRESLFNTLINRGAACNERGDLDAADAAYARAVPLVDKLDLKKAANASFATSLAGNLNNQGLAYDARGKPDKAAAAYRQTLAVAGRLRDLPAGGSPRRHPRRCAFQPRQLPLQGGQGRGSSARVCQGDRGAGPSRCRKGRRRCAGPAVPAQLSSRLVGPGSLRRYDTALADWDRTIALTAVLGRSPLRLERADCLARMGRHVQAAAEADKLTEQPGAPRGGPVPGGLCSQPRRGGSAQGRRTGRRRAESVGRTLCGPRGRPAAAGCTQGFPHRCCPAGQGGRPGGTAAAHRTSSACCKDWSGPRNSPLSQRRNRHAPLGAERTGSWRHGNPNRGRRSPKDRN